MPETKPLDLPQQSHPEVAAIADVPLKQAASKAAFIGMLARVHWVLVGNAGVYLAGLAIIVNHDKGGFNGGHLTIEVSKFMGLSSERIFACHLDSPHGQSVRDWLTRGADRGSIAATPLDAAVEFVKNCGSLAELRKMLCRADVGPVGERSDRRSDECVIASTCPQCDRTLGDVP